MKNPLGLLFIAFGIFAMAGAICDWEWYMNSRKARGLVKLFGRTATRVFYTILGLGLLVFGVLMTFGAIQE